MAKVIVTIKTKLPNLLENFWTGGSIESEMEKLLKEQITSFMARGESPVRGFGRFPSYKRPDKYPTRTGSIRGFEKRVRPVNLFLSGALYRSLASRLIGKKKFQFGTILAKDPVDIYASVHNDGKRADIPQRKFLPNVNGDELKPAIMTKVKDLFAKRLKELLDLSNK